ncbi:hypothetical protein GGR56DRAFT_274741 [Xylariaceae sp. FL0804]|nr:hypothetical protein GGR56DRAFT_274741 [Xylariaceae sp. FL0804]
MLRPPVLGAVCAGRSTIRAAALSTAGARRAFTSTARRDARMIHFHEDVSSEELANLLRTIRTKIILPTYLPLKERKKLYSPRYKKKLEAEPIMIDIDGEIIKFRYLDPQTELPKTRDSVMEAVLKFETPEDLRNLKPLLEGINRTTDKINPNTWARMVRILCQRGHLYDVIECARSVRRTGFKLDTSERVNLLLLHAQRKAVDTKWGFEETRQALRWAAMVLEMLEDEEHQPHRPQHKQVEGEPPLSRDPMVIMAPMHLTAALVLRHRQLPAAAPQGEDDAAAAAASLSDAELVTMMERLKKYAQDVVGLWPEGRPLRQVYPPQLYKYDDRLAYLVDDRNFARLAQPFRVGLAMAARVLEPEEPELAAQLRSRQATLEGDAGVTAATPGRQEIPSIVERYNNEFGT